MSREAKRRYYEKNKDIVIAKANARRLADHATYLKEQKRYMEERKEKIGPDEVKRRARGYALKRKYGITLAQYEQLLWDQDGKCAICRQAKDVFSTNLAVDHNHKTGEIRGLLCTYCNHRMIGRHTDGAKLRRMADYVETKTGLFVPPVEKKKKKPNAKPHPNT